MDIGLLSAFLGGGLALLSPCGALLLPAFFASTVGSGPRLWLHGAVFFVGLLTVLVPLGVGAGAIGSVFLTHRGAIIITASVVMILLGAAQVLGLGFDVSRAVPGMTVLQSQVAVRAGILRTALLGAASGVAGFCAGPILGAVLTLAAAQGEAFTAGALLATYGAGMVVPLVAIAAVWSRTGTPGRSLLRGRRFRVLGREWHTTSVMTGLLIVAVGILFWATNGFVGVPELIPTDLQSGLQAGVAAMADPVVDVVALVGLAICGFHFWRRIRRQPISGE